MGIGATALEPMRRSMSGAAEGPLEGLVEHLAERGVRVRGHRELVERDSVLDGVGALLDEICSVDTDDVNSDQLVVILPEDDLGDAVTSALRERL